MKTCGDIWQRECSGVPAARLNCHCAGILHAEGMALHGTYIPDLGRFAQPDPKAGDYHGISPYVYCGGDPINYVDITGCNPVYSTDGRLIRVTDTGLKGEPIVIDITNLTEEQYRAMSDDEIKTRNLGVEGLVSDEAKERYNKSVESLPTRPDWDGYLTLSEANDWYRNGNGEPLFADLRKIDLSGVAFSDDCVEGEFKAFNLFFLNDSESGKVYGSITLRRLANNTVRAFDDTYDFDMKKVDSPRTAMRNFATMVGKIRAGRGTPYIIQLYGTAKLNNK